jgi:hypothetical protein
VRQQRVVGAAELLAMTLATGKKTGQQTAFPVIKLVLGCRLRPHNLQTRRSSEVLRLAKNT